MKHLLLLPQNFIFEGFKKYVKSTGCTNVWQSCVPVILTQSRLFLKNGLNTNLMKRSIIIVKYLSTSYVPGSELNAAGVRPRKMYQSLSKKKKNPFP